MDIQFEEKETKGAFFIKEGDKRVAEMTFSKAGGNIFIIDSTRVDDNLRGKNAGKQMVQAAVNHAREHQYKIIPLCPFAKSVFEKEKSFQDVLNQ
ncbi:MAG: N-acetyltransferase [Cyclobacteriaceae bacterium]|nr:N-acetyltransferase [Cyclobacteriaceae bacterium]